MKCPYCEEALLRVDSLDFIYHCDNVFCEETEGMGGTKGLWQELIRTRKALDVAVDLLKIMNDGLPNGNRWKWEIDKALDQIKITMQEQPNDN